MYRCSGLRVLFYGANLNYVEVIIGKELTFDKKTHTIRVVRDNYHDRNGKTVIAKDPDNVELLEYVKNIYYVLLSRGIKGCYIFIEDGNLKEYFEQVVKITQNPVKIRCATHP